jgi:hypothetical protein
MDRELVKANVNHVIDNMTAEDLEGYRQAWLKGRSTFEVITSIAVKLLPLITGLSALYMFFSDIDGDWSLIAAMIVAILMDKWYDGDAKMRFYRDLLAGITMAVIKKMEEQEKAK